MKIGDKTQSAPPPKPIQQERRPEPPPQPKVETPKSSGSVGANLDVKA